VNPTTWEAGWELRTGLRYETQEQARIDAIQVLSEGARGVQIIRIPGDEKEPPT
jgi:hypothetical protein